MDRRSGSAPAMEDESCSDLSIEEKMSDQSRELISLEIEVSIHEILHKTSMAQLTKALEQLKELRLECQEKRLTVKRLLKKTNSLKDDVEHYDSKEDHYIQCMKDHGLDIEEVTTPRNDTELFIGRVTMRDAR